MRVQRRAEKATGIALGEVESPHTGNIPTFQGPLIENLCLKPILGPGFSQKVLNGLEINVQRSTLNNATKAQPLFSFLLVAKFRF